MFEDVACERCLVVGPRISISIAHILIFNHFVAFPPRQPTELCVLGPCAGFEERNTSSLPHLIILKYFSPIFYSLLTRFYNH